MITIVEVKNPLQPSAGRTTREMDWHGGERLDSFLVRCVSPRSEFDHITVSLNGRVWERSLWGELTLKDGDCVVCAPRLAGGNLVLTGSGATPNSGYTWLVATNLAPPIHWLTNSTGTLDNTGGFSNSIPLNQTQATSFFRLRMP